VAGWAATLTRTAAVGWDRTAMLGAFLTALPVVAVTAACDLALLYGALWLGAK